MAKPVFATNDVPTAQQWNSWAVNVNFARKSTTQAVSNSNTLQNDTELFFPIEANAIYDMLAVIRYDGPAAGDFKILFRTPTGGSMFGAMIGIASSAATAFDGVQIPVGGNGSFDVGTLGAGTQSLVVHGMVITAGTAGNLSIEWAQNTINASATSLQLGSYMTARRQS